MPFLTSNSFCFSTVIFSKKCTANLLFFSNEISYKLFFMIAKINISKKYMVRYHKCHYALLELATSPLEYKTFFPQGQTSNPIDIKNT